MTKATDFNYQQEVQIEGTGPVWIVRGIDADLNEVTLVRRDRRDAEGRLHTMLTCYIPGRDLYRLTPAV